MSARSAPAWPSRAALEGRLSDGLRGFDRTHTRLPGVASPDARRTLARQMVASVRRLDFTALLLRRPIDTARADPASDMFDPERAAILHLRAGRMDEAAWLVFLSVHFGKHPRHGWRTLKDVYSGLGGAPWMWDRVKASPAAFRRWLTDNERSIGGAFGNHRKYESLNGDRPTGTGAAVESYVAWIGPGGSHARRFADLVRAGGNDPQAIFEHFYQGMGVARFGRLAKFDLLCLLGRLGLAPIAPGRAYLDGATGPLRGARLLFGARADAPLRAAELEARLGELDQRLNVGMQVMEDALCNWQKSPTEFVHFTG